MKKATNWEFALQLATGMTTGVVTGIQGWNLEAALTFMRTTKTIHVCFNAALVFYVLR